MKHHFTRGVFIALITFLLGGGVYYLTSLETALGLDTLFKIRGVRKPPPEAVVVAMDETSETRLGVGQDLTRWRSFHAKLVQQLQRQGAALVVFDLQFIASHLGQDQQFASAMRTAGNVLITDCLQKISGEDKEFSGREECSESNKQPPAEHQPKNEKQVDDSNSLVIRKISPTPLLARSALDHSPFFLPNDAGNPTIREVWPFLDMFSHTPTLPVVAWLHYLERMGFLQNVVQPSQPFSAWLTEQRKQCFSGLGKTHHFSYLSDKTAVLGQSFKQSLNKVLCLDDTHHLDYYGPPQTFRMESYSAVYEGKVADLQGKVVFVGKANRTFSPGKTDFFQTPFTGTRSGKMAGVEIMATHFANLLEGRFITPTFPPALVFLVFGLVTGLMLTQLPGFIGIAASLLLGGAYVGVAAWCFQRSGQWLPVVVPLLIQLPVAWLLSLLWSRRDLLNERKRIIAFVRQVFPQWMPFLPTSPGQWYPENGTKELTSEQDVFGLCLATDIEGYTTVAAQHTPHEMWELLNSYYHVLGHPVSSHKGIIADITGDAMMAVWIAKPIASQRLAACLAALEMELAVERFNEASIGGQLPTRIGLHEGEMTLGRIEAGEGSVFRAIGDTVNTASRIQGVNKYLGTRILASSAIIAGLSDIICRPVGLFRLVGRAEPSELAEIIGMSAEVAEAQIALNKQFASGLSAFQEGRWERAEMIFQTILEDYGQDGPSQFYLNYMGSFPGVPPSGWDGVVMLLGK
jgi:adenylate cyclase